jgi:hypothetical protein
LGRKKGFYVIRCKTNWLFDWYMILY